MNKAVSVKNNRKILYIYFLDKRSKNIYF